MKKKLEAFRSISEIRRDQQREVKIQAAMRDILIGQFRENTLYQAVHQTYCRRETRTIINKLFEAWSQAFSSPITYEYGYVDKTVRPATSFAVDSPAERLAAELQQTPDWFGSDQSGQFSSRMTALFHDVAKAGYDTIFSVKIADCEFGNVHFRLIPKVLPDGVILSQFAVSFWNDTIYFGSRDEFYVWCDDFVNTMATMTEATQLIVARKNHYQLKDWIQSYSAFLANWWFHTMKRKYQK